MALRTASPARPVSVTMSSTAMGLPALNRAASTMCRAFMLLVGTRRGKTGADAWGAAAKTDPGSAGAGDAGAGALAGPLSADGADAMGWPSRPLSASVASADGPADFAEGPVLASGSAPAAIVQSSA